MGSRSFADYGIDPLGLSGEENEQVADLIDQNNDLLNEVRRNFAPARVSAQCALGHVARCAGLQKSLAAQHPCRPGWLWQKLHARNKVPMSHAMAGGNMLVRGMGFFSRSRACPRTSLHKYVSQRAQSAGAGATVALGADRHRRRGQDAAQKDCAAQPFAGLRGSDAAAGVPGMTAASPFDSVWPACPHVWAA